MKIFEIKNRLDSFYAKKKFLVLEKISVTELKIRTTSKVFRKILY